MARSTLYGRTVQHLSPGSLSRPITIQSPVDVDDGTGGKSRTWVTAFSCWASIMPKSGQEPYTNEQLYPNAMYTVTIRWRRGVVPGMRVVLGTHIMRIRAMRDIEYSNVSIVMDCEELQTEGIVK